MNQKKKNIKNPKVSRSNEIRKIREEINKTEIQKTIERIIKTKRWFFKKVNKIDKPFARFIKKIGNENGEVTTNTTDMQRIMSLL